MEKGRREKTKGWGEEEGDVVDEKAEKGGRDTNIEEIEDENVTLIIPQTGP